MDFKSILILLLSIAWLLLCQRWYCCWMQEACAECSDSPINSYPIGFNEGNSNPDTTYKFSDLISRLLMEKKQDHFLEVSGRYIDTEGKKIGYDRAAATSSLLSSNFPKDSISIRSQRSITNNFSNEVFLPMVDIQWVPLPKMEIPGLLIIEFPVKLAIAELTSDQNESITYIAKYAKVNNVRIKVSGHSDATGDEAMNKLFSEQRAEKIAEKLINLGVPSNLIVTESFGSLKPRNLVNTGKNRRVEITVLN